MKNVQLPDSSVVAFPDTMDDAAIGTAIQKYLAQKAAPAAAAPAQPSMLQQAGQWGAQQLSAIGGVLGAAVGAPALALGQPEIPAGGAMAGAMGGEALRQLAMRAMGAQAPQTPQQAIGGINMAGALQGGLQGAAEGVGNAVKGASKAFMESALGQRALTGVDRALVALRENVAPTRAGLKTVMGKLGDAGEVVRNLIGMADKQGYKMAPQELTTATAPLEQELHQTAEVPRFRGTAGGFVENPSHPANQMVDRNASFEEAHPNGITPSQLAIKIKAWDKVAAPIFKRAETKEAVTPAELQNAKWSKAMADQGRVWLRSLPDVGPRIAEANDRASELIQLKQAILQPARRQMTPGAMLAGRMLPAAAGATLGGLLPGSPTQRIERGAALGLGGFAAGAGAQQAATPEALGQIALMLHNPMLADALAHPAATLGPAALAQLYQAHRK